MLQARINLTDIRSVLYLVILTVTFFTAVHFLGEWENQYLPR